MRQVDGQGRPVLDLGHVLACLNKLDAGTEERVMLVSRDEQSVLVVSYRDVRRCVEAAFACVLPSFFPLDTHHADWTLCIYRELSRR